MRFLFSKERRERAKEKRDWGRHGDKVSKITFLKETDLQKASKIGDARHVLELLRDVNLDVNAQRDDGATALWLASSNGHVAVVRALLLHRKVDVNLQINEDVKPYYGGETAHKGATALYVASSYGHVEVVHALLQHHMVDVNLRSAYGATALYVACEEGHLEVVRELLQHYNVDVHLQSNYGATALDMAYSRENSDLARLLEDYMTR